MKHLRFSSNILSVTVLALAFASLAHAQSTRTWVSGVGSDMNPCSRTAPCKTFAGALTQTTAGGEIDCIDPGDFGNGSMLNITQAVTIDCGGTFGSIFLTPAGAPVININAGSNDVVTLRNLSITGGLGGIHYAAAKAVHVEHVRVSAPGGGCIELVASAAALLTVDDATLSDCPGGILAGTNSGTAVANISNARITNTTSGIQADNGSRVTIRDSVIYFNTFGIQQTNLLGSNLGSTVTVVNSTLGYSGTAALQSRSGQFILAFGNTFVNDVLAFNPNGGSIFTGADNNNSGSTPGTANGGTVPKI